MSVLSLKADIRQREWHVRLVPLTDMQRGFSRLGLARWQSFGRTVNYNLGASLLGLYFVHPETEWGSSLQVVEARSGVRDRLHGEGLDARLGGINRFMTSAMPWTDCRRRPRQNATPPAGQVKRVN